MGPLNRVRKADIILWTLGKLKKVATHKLIEGHRHSRLIQEPFYKNYLGVDST